MKQYFVRWVDSATGREHVDPVDGDVHDATALAFDVKDTYGAEDVYVDSRRR